MIPDENPCGVSSFEVPLAQIFLSFLWKTFVLPIAITQFPVQPTCQWRFYRSIPDCDVESYLLNGLVDFPFRLTLGLVAHQTDTAKYLSSWKWSRLNAWISEKWVKFLPWFSMTLLSVHCSEYLVDWEPALFLTATPEINFLVILT